MDSCVELCIGLLLNGASPSPFAPPPACALSLSLINKQNLKKEAAAVEISKRRKQSRYSGEEEEEMKRPEEDTVAVETENLWEEWGMKPIFNGVY